MTARPALNKALLPFVAMAMCMLLGSCGFTPAYGEKSEARAVLERIRLENPRDRNEYRFLKAVEARIPQSADPLYEVRYRVRARDRGVPVRGVPRRQLHGDVRYHVVDLSSGKRVLTDEIETFTSYTDEGDLRIPQKLDAEERLMQILADQFVTRMTIKSARIAPRSE